MKNKMILFFIGVFTLTILIGVQIFSRGEIDTNIEGTEEYIGNGGRITRAEVARMISLLMYDREDIESMERNIIFTDTDSSKWYDKYVNAFSTLGFTTKEEEADREFHPMAYVTFGDCQNLIDKLGTQLENETLKEQLDTVLSSLMDGKKIEDEITSQQWIQLYEIISEEGYGRKLEDETLYFIESWENSDELAKWQTATNHGIFYGDGLNFVQYLNTSYKVYIKDQEILCVLNEVEGEIQIPNIWIEEKTEEGLKVYVEGCTKEFQLAGSIEEDVSGQVGDLFLEDGKITKVSIKPDRIKGRILVTNDNYIEIENYGRKALSDDFCIYRTYGGISMDKTNSLVVGYENAEFVIVGDEICAAIITEPVVAENIRVLIKTDGFKDYYHDSVKLTANTKFSISFGDTVKEYKANKVVTIDSDSKWLKSGRILITPLKENGKITIRSMKRNGIYPAYQGTMEVASDENGLLLINELSIEKYLYGVVPSEMPTSYGLEALKVQAVCARSYAYKQLIANGLRKYGAHVDDSASYQVYNNIPSNKDAREAVNETAGEVLSYDGEIITAYYFSTSSGYTADATQVWNGTTDLEYLQGSLQLTKESSKAEKLYDDLSQQEDFTAFLKQDKYPTFDSDTPWYRWKVTMSLDKLKASIDAGLGARYEANPTLITTKQENGEYLSVPVDTVGEVKSLHITKRQKSGIVTELVIKGSKATVKVESEYNIRLLLAPIFSEITRADDSKVESLSMLPSAYFYIEEKDNGYSFHGGGYGHGVGMSQNGAKAMADEGYTYTEILQHYYHGAQINMGMTQ